MREYGVAKRAIYQDDFDRAVLSLRDGDELATVGFRGLGRTRGQIIANLERVHERAAVVLDIETGKTSTALRQRERLIDSAVKAIANERRGRRKDRHRHRMPWDQMARIWFDKTKTNAQAMELINAGRRVHVSYTTVYRKLGKRGSLPGRPSNGRLAADARI